MSWFSSDAEKTNAHDGGSASQQAEGPNFATEVLLEGLVIASGGAAPVIAGMLISHKLGRDPAIWVWFQKKFGNQKSKDIQAQVDTQQKQPVAAQETPPEAPKPNYDDFVTRFNSEFPAVSTQFADMKSDTVPQYFTAAQIDQLNQYIATKTVPPNLFHGASGPKLTAQKRILLAGVILANGKLSADMNSKDNQSRDGKDNSGKQVKAADDRTHAANCGHWASEVYLYAGVNENGFNASAPQYNTDSGGNTHVANGAPDKSNPFAFTGAKDDSLPLEGKQAYTANASADSTKWYRNKEANMDQVNQLQPGDWIYIYNANADYSGGHSEIFNGWDGEAVTEQPSGVVYRVANVMSQKSATAGGEIHKQKLGPVYDAKLGVATLTAVQRVTADSGELMDLEQVVSPSTDAENDKIITAKKIDKQKLHDYLLRKSRSDLAAKKALADNQKQMFQRAIDGSTGAETHSISLLVAACQKLETGMGTSFGKIDGSILKDIAQFKES